METLTIVERSLRMNRRATSQDSKAPRRLRIRYGLRTLLCVLSILAVCCAWFARARYVSDVQVRAVREINRLGGEAVRFDDTSPMVECAYQSERSDWRRRVLGRRFTLEETYVIIRGDAESAVSSSELREPRRVEKQWEALADIRYVLSLRVADASFTGEQLRYLDGIDHIRQLDLSNTPLEVAHLRHIVGLRNLRELKLGKTNVDDAGLEFVGKLSSLETLDLSNTAISDAGLAHLSVLSRLTFLDLSNNNISADGVAQLRGLENLFSLTMNETSVDDGLVESIGELRGLHYLDVYGTSVSDAGAARIRERLPNVQISR